MNTFLFFRNGNRMMVFLFSKRVQILKTDYKYGQYCTPLTQSDCRYFLVLAITQNDKLTKIYHLNDLQELFPEYAFDNSDHTE